jgi:hypothetical protein
MLVTANVVPSSLILVTIMEALHSSETSVLTRATQPNIPEDGSILYHISVSHSNKTMNMHCRTMII